MWGVDQTVVIVACLLREISYFRIKKIESFLSVLIDFYPCAIKNQFSVVLIILFIHSSCILTFPCTQGHRVVG